MNLRRFKRLDIWLVVAVAALPLFIAVGSFAQARRIELSDREERRLERKVDGLEKEYSGLRLEIEKRLTKIELDFEKRMTTLETYAMACVGLLGIVAAAAATQVTIRVVDRIRLHPPQSEKEGKA